MSNFQFLTPFAKLSDNERKHFVADLIDICLYNPEGYNKLIDLIEQEKVKNLTKRITIDNQLGNKVFSIL